MRVVLLIPLLALLSPEFTAYAQSGRRSPNEMNCVTLQTSESILWATREETRYRTDTRYREEPRTQLVSKTRPVEKYRPETRVEMVSLTRPEERVSYVTRTKQVPPPTKMPRPTDTPPSTPTSRPRPTSTPAPVTSSSGDVITNSIGMKMNLIQPGSFQMGSEKGDTNEKPVHEVRIGKAFYLGVYEVTQGEWKKVMGSNRSSFTGDDNLPVEQVSWEDCQEFVKKLSEKEGKEYRLPSEAEWEYACRAGRTGKYCYGDDETRLGDYAWYDKNSGNETHPVGQKQANAWGLYDMHGNVWEWCQDRWHGSYEGAPTNGTPWEAGSGARVSRGGSWSSVPYNVRSAGRNGYDPSDRDSTLGFRVCKPLD